MKVCISIEVVIGGCILEFQLSIQFAPDPIGSSTPNATAAAAVASTTATAATTTTCGRRMLLRMQCVMGRLVLGTPWLSQVKQRITSDEIMMEGTCR
jgi:hypothetical protein